MSVAPVMNSQIGSYFPATVQGNYFSAACSNPVYRSEFVDNPASGGRMNLREHPLPLFIRGENLMKAIKQISAGVLLSAGLLSGGIFSSSAMAAECIAPANPGGGWDFTCRSIGKIMYDIGAVDKPIQVTNMAGGGGGLAYTHVVSERSTDEELIVAASSATATRLAQNAFAGMTADQVKFLEPSALILVSLWLPKMHHTNHSLICLMQLKQTLHQLLSPVVPQPVVLITLKF